MDEIDPTNNEKYLKLEVENNLRENTDNIALETNEEGFPSSSIVKILILDSLSSFILWYAGANIHPCDNQLLVNLIATIISIFGFSLTLNLFRKIRNIKRNKNSLLIMSIILLLVSIGIGLTGLVMMLGSLIMSIHC